MRIVFLVDSASANLEEVDQIIDYNRSLWGGRFNPIMLTDGHTIEDKWWEFLRDIDPDVIKPLVSLNTELIEKFENFLSPLTIENFREDGQSDLGTRVAVSDTPAGIDLNLVNSSELDAWFGGATLGIFNLDEMDDDIAKLFILRNFGTYEPTSRMPYMGAFSVPLSLESALQHGEVPSEVHEGFAKNDIPFSSEVFSKQSIKWPGSWAIIDNENKQIRYVDRQGDKLYVRPETRSFSGPLSEIKKEVYLITDRNSLATALLELSQTYGIVFRDQICTSPNMERDSKEDTHTDRFDVIVGDTLQDIVYFWNSPLLVGRWKRKFMNQIWLPTILATDPDMEDALCAWINKVAYRSSNTPGEIRFVSFSTEERELEDIASRFRENRHVQNLHVRTVAACFREPQIPNFRPEDPFFRHIGNSVGIHRTQGNEDILELTEPKGLAPHDTNGHWMADFYIEFIHDRYVNHEDMRAGRTPFWQFPNRNHLMRYMFDKPSRVKRNGFPSVMMQKGKKVLCFTLRDAESVVASLFCRDNRPIHEHSDPRTQLATSPYDSVEPSDKGKYLQGVLELFGNLTFANQILSNPYWRAMLDALSKNTSAEQNAHKSTANKLTKLIRGKGSLTHEDSEAIESLTAHIINESKKLDLKQKEFPFDKFVQEAEQWQEKYVSENDQSEVDIEYLDFRPEDVRNALEQLTRRNIVQVGIKPSCPSCGMANWYHVDDIHQHLTCQGCRTQFSLHPELTWHYRLNELIHAVHALHGTTPVILVLGHLLNESRTSFLFSPNLNLLSEPQDKSSERLEKTAEVDIACIQDGKFIIGEVKQSMSLFKTKDFDDIAEIAKRTKPDQVLFSCIDSLQPTSFITGNIERIEKELSPLEIDVEWYRLNDLDYSTGVW